MENIIKFDTKFKLSLNFKIHSPFSLSWMVRYNGKNLRNESTFLCTVFYAIKFTLWISIAFLIMMSKVSIGHSDFWRSKSSGQYTIMYEQTEISTFFYIFFKIYNSYLATTLKLNTIGPKNCGCPNSHHTMQLRGRILTSILTAMAGKLYRGGCTFGLIS